MSSKKTTLTEVLDAAFVEKAFTGTPPEILQLYAKSRYIIKTHSATLDDTTTWAVLLQHFHLSLITGRDSEAELILQRLTDRFGASCERVVLCKSQYIEATAGIEKAEEFLKSRESKEIIVQKRKAALIKFKNDDRNYIIQLLALLEFIPTDAETWTELGDAYFKVHEYEKAIHAFQETLLASPYAYNVFARLGESYHALSLQQSNDGNLNYNAKQKIVYSLTQALKNFLRSIELCPVYVRGWAGVQVVSSEALKFISQDKSAQPNRKSELVTEKELKYFTKFSELSERKLLYMTTDEDSKIPKSEIAAAKAILQNY